jgi:predicted O-methyltransferase YrrM
MGLMPKKYHGIGGHISMKEAQFLFETINRVGPGWYADLGTFKGRSACALAAGILESRESGAVLTVDAFTGQGMSKKEYYTEFEVADHLKERNLLDIIEIIRGDTTATAADYQNLRFKFIFFDASHDYDSIKADFTAWSPLLAINGELAFHDSFSHKHGVHRFLEELPALGWTQQGIVDTITWWKRKRQ